MNLSGQSTIKGIETTKLLKIQDWCRIYNKKCRYPTDFLTRYGIALYQIHQGMDWQGKTPANAYEGFMSAVINIILASEQADIGLETYCHADLKDCIEFGLPNWKHILYWISNAQQMFFYLKNQNKTGRESRRYKPMKLCVNLASIINSLVNLIPVKERSQAVWNSTRILSEELGK